MNKQFDEFLHEVEEDLKWEKIEKYAKEYGSYVLAAILIIILGTAGYVYWNHSQLKNREAQSELFTKAAQLTSETKNEDASKLLDDIIAKGGDYAMFAEFQKADLLAKNPETKQQAVDLYLQMINERKIDRRYRSLAVIFYVQMQLDKGDPEQMMKLLQEASVGSNLWPGITSELTALVAIRLGDKEQAQSILNDLVNSQETSPGVRTRANALLHTLKLDVKGE